jgi:hypothetical protein
VQISCADRESTVSDSADTSRTKYDTLEDVRSALGQGASWELWLGCATSVWTRTSDDEKATSRHECSWSGRAQAPARRQRWSGRPSLGFSASAGLKIHLVFLREQPQPAGVVGGGNLQEIFQVAAEAWEDVFKSGNGHWDVTIEFGWGPIGSQSARVDEVITQGGNPVRITHARVTFNNLPINRPNFYSDPTPRDSTEYKKYVSYLADEAPLNLARSFIEGTGVAADALDLLTIATHEIGHALAFHDFYLGFQEKCVEPTTAAPVQPQQGARVIIDDGTGGLTTACIVTITAPRPFAGLEFTIQFGPHFGTIFRDANPLMDPDVSVGERRLISSLDALVIAELASFSKPNLDGMLPPSR